MIARKFTLAMIGATVLGAAAVPARADLFGDLAVALDFVGFDLQGQRNVYGGGADFRLTQDFNQRRFDFGAGELFLDGPISFEFHTNGRALNEIELSFQTALTENAQRQPLFYDLRVDTGPEASSIAGSMLIDGNLSFNSFGYYEVQLNYSSRQDIAEDEVFRGDNTVFNDVDVGPIDISGNIYIDLVSLILDPVFNALNIENPLLPLSGQGQLANFFSPGAQFAPDATAAKSLLHEVRNPPLVGIDSSVLTGTGDDGQSADAGFTVVPEPGTLLLLAAGAVPVCILRRRTRKA